jgi:hypothetical protein
MMAVIMVVVAMAAATAAAVATDDAPRSTASLVAAFAETAIAARPRSGVDIIVISVSDET